MASNNTSQSRENTNRQTTNRQTTNRQNADRESANTRGAPRKAMTDRGQHDRERSIEVGRDAGRGVESRRIGSFWRDLWSDRAMFGQPGWAPEIETFRRGDALVVRADLPGLEKADVNVEIDNGVLSISGERCEDHTEDRDGFYRSERSYGQFYRALPRPEGVSDEQCEATFKDGVLEVTIPIPKQRERSGKRIPIR